MTDQQLLSEISLRCGDPEFKDFEPSIYKRAIYRSNRDVALQYGLLQKIYTFTTGDMVGSPQDQILLNLPDFKSEYLVSVNGIPLVKVANQLEPQFRYCYFMERIEGQWHFDYLLGFGGYDVSEAQNSLDITEQMSMSYPERIEDGAIFSASKGLKDQVVIAYTIIPNIETEIGEYDIDTKYEEEQIKRAVSYMAELGIAKYPGENEKGEKYTKLYRMYQLKSRSQYDPRIAKDSEFVKIQPWSVI